MLKKKITKQRMFAVSVFAAMVVATSCDGVNSDAKKAASLTNKSIEKTGQLKLEEAEKLYKKSREIIDEYDKFESRKKSEKFFKLYRQYRDKEIAPNLDKPEPNRG